MTCLESGSITAILLTAGDNLKAETNNFQILTWEFEELATSVNFLDLTISIEKAEYLQKHTRKT